MIQGHDTSPPSDSRTKFRIRLALWALLAVFFLLQFRSIYTETINWDEFALFHRAQQSLDTGTIVGGGRPGLATLLLMPVVANSDSEFNAIYTGRIIWFFITLSFVIGFYLYLKTALRTKSSILPFFGTALLILNPFFIRCSVQVRTDQLALALSIFACICLLRRAIGWHLLAAVLFAAAFLATQKTLYVMGIGLTLAYLQPLIEGPLRIKYNGLRLIFFALVFGLFIKGWQAISSIFFLQASLGHSVGKQLDVFDYYSQSIGYSYYTESPQFWFVHIILGIALLGQILHHLFAGRRFTSDLIKAISILLLGIVVGFFHKAAFPYFVMVLGLFTAIGFSFSLKCLPDTFPGFFRRESWRVCCLTVMFFCLTGLSLPYIISQQTDTQRVQRESLSYVRNNFYGAYEGFQPEGALFLQLSKSPFKTYFTQNILNDFGPGVPERKTNIEDFILKFHQNKIGFLIHSYRIDQFPDEIRTFMFTHYVPWKDSVYLAGTILNSSNSLQQDVGLVVSGRYVWLPGEGDIPIRIDGNPVVPNQPKMLKAGAHSVQYDTNNVSGHLVLYPGDMGNFSFTRTFYVHGFHF